MSVTIHSHDHTLSAEELSAWAGIPVSIAVDLEPESQIDPSIRLQTRTTHPLHLLGPAVTVKCSPPDFGAVVQVMDHAKAGDVVVIAADGAVDTAVIGDILGGHLRNIGCAGLVVDGVVRDIEALGSWPDFPVFAKGVNPRGPTSADEGEINGSVVLGGSVVNPGDLLIGDSDGLVAYRPQQARDRLKDALARLELEKTWIDGLKSGKSVSEVFGD